MAVAPLQMTGRRQHHSAPFTPFPNGNVVHRTVTTAAAETVPAGCGAVIITADAAIWISGGTAVVPSSDVTDGTGSVFLGAGVARGFYVSPGQALSVISASGTAHVSFEYLADPL